MKNSTHIEFAWPCFTWLLCKFWIFSICGTPPPQLSGCILFAHSPDARAIFLHDDLLCKDACSVIGGETKRTGGAQTEKILNLMSKTFPKQMTYLFSVFQCILWPPSVVLRNSLFFQEPWRMDFNHSKNLNWYLIRVLNEKYSLVKCGIYFTISTIKTEIS